MMANRIKFGNNTARCIRGLACRDVFPRDLITKPKRLAKRDGVENRYQGSQVTELARAWDAFQSWRSGKEWQAVMQRQGGQSTRRCQWECMHGEVHRNGIPLQRTAPWGREVAGIQRQEKGSSYRGAEDDRQSDKMRTQEITEHQERRLVSQADWPQPLVGSDNRKFID
jgi:hypothetical protein